MRPNYKLFIDRMIQKYEGGYGWDAGDPGGPTKYGITCYDLAEHRGQQMLSMTAWAPQVQKMTLSEAEDIYAKKYAAAIRFDDLPSGVDCVVLDYAVNSGIGRAVLVLQTMFHRTGEPRSTLSLQLLKDIRSVPPDVLIDQLCDERLGFMKRIRKGTAWKTFGRGWQARVDDLRSYAKSRFGPAAVTKPLTPMPRVPKATNKPSAAPASQHAATGGLVGLVGTLLHDHPYYAATAVFALVVALVDVANDIRDADPRRDGLR